MKKYEIKRIGHFTYSLRINGEYAEALYETIRRMLKDVHYDEDDNTSIYFPAKGIKRLSNNNNKQQQHYQETLKMIGDLSKQLSYLESIGYSLYGFDIDDILIIENTYLLCSTRYLLPLTANANKIRFDSPINKPQFSNPEIEGIKVLPAEISRKCCYYSLGTLVAFLFFGITPTTNKQEQEQLLEPFRSTKIYWFIKRTFGLSGATCGLSGATCGLSGATCGLSGATCGLSGATCGLSEATCGLSEATLEKQTLLLI